LSHKLNDYFKINIKISLINKEILIIIKEDLFYCIDIENTNISSFNINNVNLVIESMIFRDLCFKQFNDIKIIGPAIVSLVLYITFIIKTSNIG
jgi:hypothetical protein